MAARGPNGLSLAAKSPGDLMSATARQARTEDMQQLDRIAVIVMAHNEERRIAACLASLPLGEPGVTVHVVVNGSTDRTAQIARDVSAGRATVHDWAEGGKSRSWNRIVLDTPGLDADAFVFVDGDAQVVAGSIDALVAALAADREANAASAMPRNGRRAQYYADGIERDHGLFGDLYALSGRFVARMRAAGVRLPEDLVGDDALICALAKTGLANEDDWRDTRVVVCRDAGFLCEPVSLASPHTLRIQYRRMINYSVRHFQNRIVSEIMRGPGPTALPVRLSDRYPDWFHRFVPRSSPALWWFDRKAIERMRLAVR